MRKSIFTTPYYKEAPKTKISPVTKDLLAHIRAKINRTYPEGFTGLWYVNERDNDGGIRFIARIEEEDSSQALTMRVSVSRCVDFMTYGPVGATMELKDDFDTETGFPLAKNSIGARMLNEDKIYTVFDSYRDE